MIFGDTSQLLLFLPGFIIGLTIHEFSHALIAHLLGDKYPRSMGRLTLNPFAHLSALGSLAIALIGFGWARPVQVNVYNLKNPRRDFFLISMAGPISNILLMLLCTTTLRLVPGITENAMYYILYGAIANGMLALLNLLPIPPLDGSRIWMVIFPQFKVNSPRMRSIFTVILLFVVFTGLLDPVFNMLVHGIFQLSGLNT